MPRVKIIVSGKVQGVYFRAFTAEQSERLGVNGTVRNLPDGAVEIVAEAERAALDALIEQCRQGPPAAQVQRLDICNLPTGAPFKGFQVVR